uniref:Histone domain-containing protein n=1 Tax=Heligmosomoides polygyrus TaxID=6339 RepID=A0A183GV13_HELPZ
LFEDTNLCAIHAKRVTIMPKDIQVARRIRVYNSGRPLLPTSVVILATIPKSMGPTTRPVEGTNDPKNDLGAEPRGIESSSSSTGADGTETNILQEFFTFI